MRACALDRGIRECHEWRADTREKGALDGGAHLEWGFEHEAVKVGRVRSGVRSGAQRLKGRSAVGWVGMESELIVRLRKIARLLMGVYSSCVTAELALRGQNAERDFEIGQALRMHVSGPVSREAEELDAVVVALAPRVGGKEILR